MSKNTQNSKEKIEGVTKTFTDAAKSKNGKILIVAILVMLLLLNIIWTGMDGRTTSKIEALKTELETKMAEVQKGTVNHEEVKADIIAINKATDVFETRMEALVKLEESKLESLIRDVEAQKAYLEELKVLSGK